MSINAEFKRWGPTVKASKSDHADVDELLTVKEVAQKWKVSTKTVRRRIEEGQLKCVRIGRLVRIRRRHLSELIGE
jgi:excisionase family DNA binding protein